MTNDRRQVAGWPRRFQPVDCWCMTCDEAANGFRSRMSLCPECGDKRCPRAEFHGNKCANPEKPEPEQEPVAPARRPLTDEEINALWRKTVDECNVPTTAALMRGFARAIERKITGGKDE